jgi:steroid delta-isomerase-like uncharacterized protein
MFRFILAVTLAAAACSPASLAGEKENVATANALFAAFNAKDVEGMVRLYAPDAEYISPDVPTGSRGHETIRGVYTDLFRAIPDVHDTVVRMVAQGDIVAVEFVARGTAPAQPDRPAQKFALPIASFLTFDKQGRIVRDAAYFDK